MAQRFRALLEAAKAWVSTLPQKMRRLNTRKGRKAAVKVLSTVGKCVLTVMLVGIISACLIGGVLAIYVVSNFDATGKLPELGKLSMENRSVVYVQNAAGEYEEYQNLLGGNTVWVDLDKIPVNLQNAVIAIEDERFREHNGVDWSRTISAMVNLVANRVFHLGTNEYGGSSITQQLIKVTTQNKDHSIERKINEIMLALELEKSEYTKDQVLEGYLNNMPLTGELVGVGIGARYYFGKEVSELSLAECAVMASITNNPSVYSPYGHPENVRQRQKIVLAKMYELKFITEEEYKQALSEELVFKSSAAHQSVQDYYVDQVVEDVINDLMTEYGYSYTYAENMVFYGGLKIYSAEDPKLQSAVEAIYADEANFPALRQNDKEHPEGAFFAVDYTGRVVATVGGRGEKEANRVLNRSTQSLRSPGSSIKPITAYGPSIALDLVHYSSPVRDAPIVLSDGTLWPHNYEVKDTPDNGDVLLGVALQKSLNTVSARLVQGLTPRRSFEYATNIFQLKTLVESKVVNGAIHSDVALSPLALGAFTDGVTARDMASAYGVFGSGGNYNEPYTYYLVTTGDDEDETELLKGGQNSVEVLDSASSYIMIKLMQRVTTLGTAADVGRAWPGWSVYGKTGTSESKRDVYFTGGTAYYAAASWFGYDNNQVMISTQTGYAKSLWNKAMKALHQNLQIKDFTKPEGVEVWKYCTVSGQLATSACTATDTGWYKSTNKPGYCAVHGGQALNPDGTVNTATSATPTGSTTVPTGSTTGSLVDGSTTSGSTTDVTSGVTDSTTAPSASDTTAVPSASDTTAAPSATEAGATTATTPSATATASATAAPAVPAA